jgi:phage terminase large subunit-like protein
MGALLARRAWFLSARLSQYPLLGGPPPTWLVTGGRGAGKTRLGAEWANALVRGLPPFAVAGQRQRRLALIGETLADVRDVMVEGPSGIIGVSQPWPAL